MFTRRLYKWALGSFSCMNVVQVWPPPVTWKDIWVWAVTTKAAANTHGRVFVWTEACSCWDPCPGAQLPSPVVVACLAFEETARLLRRGCVI